MTREEALERVHDPRPLPLEGAEQASFEQWLERDAELRTIAEEQRALFAAMDAWEDGAEPSLAFEQRLWTRIEAEERARPTLVEAVTAWLSWPRAAWAGCAVALAATVVTWVGPERPPVETEKVAKVEAVSLSGEDAEFLRDIDLALDDMEMLMEFDALAPHASPEGRI